MAKRQFNIIDNSTVECIVRKAGYSSFITLPAEWLGKKVICKVVEEKLKETTPDISQE